MKVQVRPVTGWFSPVTTKPNEVELPPGIAPFQAALVALTCAPDWVTCTFQ